jgi:predicted  nucleic acid-binding Zn-ribbon protein
MSDVERKHMVRALLPLQEVDFEIHSIKRQMEIKPRDLAQTEAQVAYHKKLVDSAKNDIKNLKLEAMKFETEVKGKDDQIKKLEGDSLKAKKNEEYLLIQKQISGIRADKQVIEDRWLEFDFKIEHATKKAKMAEDELKQAEAKLAEEKSRVAKEMAVLEGRLKEETEKRKGLTKDIDKDLLGKYERILSSRSTDGRALAKVVKHVDMTDRKPEPKRKKKGDPEPEQGFEAFRYSCEGCQSEITFQDVNLLLSGREVLMCRNCSRLLYTGDSVEVPKA